MKTTELYLEQTFIGALIMAILAAPLLPDLLHHRAVFDGVAHGIAVGSIALGVAFWLGIPFDRLADTLSERLERHNRLRFALKKLESEGKSLPAAERDGRSADIFPEDEMVAARRRESATVVGWMDYHRSRIRLARAMAVYGPALAVMLTVGTLRIDQPLPGRLAYWYGGVGLLYFLWAVLAQAHSKSLRLVSAFLPQANSKPLRTDYKVEEYARDWGFIKDRCIKESDYSDPRIWLYERRLLAVPLLLLLGAIWVSHRFGNRHSVGVAWVTAALTVLSAWTWWRISFTYRSYLLDFHRFPLPPKAAAEKTPGAGASDEPSEHKAAVNDR
jgi:hypothetical protein